MGGYVGSRRIRPFLGYIRAKQAERDELTAYRVFVTESLRLAPQGKALSKGLYEVIENAKAPAETRDSDELAADIINRLGLEVTE